ncbi:MAG: CIA30 family protein [Planctomycetota bacterium]|nr:CIA30 family protein [Planctomycetota bacterium]
MNTLIIAAALPLLPAPLLTQEVDTQPIARFEDEASIAAWRPNHDRVMGGVSTGRPSWSEGAMRLTGELSLENNGGFASFRWSPEGGLDLSEADGLRLRVRGDGRNWKVSLRTRQGRRGMNWQAPFMTSNADAWQTVLLPFDAFEPSYRGRLVRTEEPIELARVATFGITVADGQEGDYALEVASIEAWSSGAAEPRAGTLAAREARTSALVDALAGEPTADRLIEALRDAERVLVVAEPLSRGSYGKAASIQLGRFMAKHEELTARDMRVVHLLGDRATLVAGSQLGPEATRSLRAAWGLRADAYACVLVGKDGGVKERWGELVAAEQVIAPVDRMPMRRREARERSTGR